MTNVSLDGDESLSQQPLSPGENMGDLVLPQLEERIETLKESDPCPFKMLYLYWLIRRSGSKCMFKSEFHQLRIVKTRVWNFGIHFQTSMDPAPYPEAQYATFCKEL
jgi:hypothetical protein